MPFLRVVAYLVVATLFSCSSITADAFLVKSKRLTVLGMLTEDMAVGPRPAWSIQLNPVIMVHGRQITSLEIKSADTRKLASLEDKFVQASGKLTLTTAVEPAESPVFELTSIKEHKSRRLGRWF